MGRSLRLGIVGLGFGAKVHLPAFLSIPGVKVVAVADLVAERVSQVAVVMGIPHAFSDWRDMLNIQGIEAISVVTPPSFQAEIVCAALEAGKHVLCEKTFGKDLSEALRMFEVAKNSQLIHAINFQFRMEPGIRELNRQVKAGAIGQVQRIDVTWLTGGRSDPFLPWSWQYDAELGGGVLNGFGSHVIDYVEWINQSPIVGVFAQSRILIGYREDIDGRKRKVTAEDSCDLVCDLADGVIANLRFSNGYPFGLGHRIEIYGKQGGLVYSHEMPFTPDKAAVYIETDARGLRPVQFEELATEANLDTRIAPFRELAVRFVETVWGHTRCDLPDFSHGLRSRKVLEAARDSEKRQRRISIRRE